MSDEEGRLWYVRTDDAGPAGPAGTDLVRRGIAAGRIPLTALVCEVGDAEWIPITSVPIFAPSAPSRGQADEVAESPQEQQRRAVEAFLEGRLLPESTPETVYVTERSRFRVDRGTIEESTDPSLVGAELVAWYAPADGHAAISPRWTRRSRAILFQRMSKEVIVTPRVVEASPVIPRTQVLATPGSASRDEDGGAQAWRELAAQLQPLDGGQHAVPKLVGPRAAPRLARSNGTAPSKHGGATRMASATDRGRRATHAVAIGVAALAVVVVLVVLVASGSSRSSAKVALAVTSVGTTASATGSATERHTAPRAVDKLGMVPLIQDAAAGERTTVGLASVFAAAMLEGFDADPNSLTVESIENGTLSWEGRILPAEIVRARFRTVNRSAAQRGTICFVQVGAKDQEFALWRAMDTFPCEVPDLAERIQRWRTRFGFKPS